MPTDTLTAPDMAPVLSPEAWLDSPQGMICGAVGIYDQDQLAALDPHSPQVRVVDLLTPFAEQLRDPDVLDDGARRSNFFAEMRTAAHDVDDSMGPYLARASVTLAENHKTRGADVRHRDHRAALGEGEEVSADDLGALSDAKHASSAADLFIRHGLREQPGIQRGVGELIARFRRKGLPKGKFEAFADKHATKAAKVGSGVMGTDPALRAGLAAGKALEFVGRHKKAIVVLGALAAAVTLADKSGVLHSQLSGLFGHHGGGGGTPPPVDAAPPRMAAAPSLAHLPPTHLDGASTPVHETLTAAHGAGGVEQVGAQGHVTWADGTNANHILHYESGPNGTTYIRLEGVDPNQSIINGHAVDLNHAHGLYARITVTGPNGHEQFYEVPIKNGQAQISGDFSKLVAGHDVQVQIVQHAGHGENVFSTAVSNGHHVSGHEAAKLSHDAHIHRHSPPPDHRDAIHAHRTSPPPALRLTPDANLTQQLEGDAAILGPTLLLAWWALRGPGHRRRMRRRARRTAARAGHGGGRPGEGHDGHDEDEDDDDDGSHGHGGGRPRPAPRPRPRPGGEGHDGHDEDEDDDDDAGEGHDDRPIRIDPRRWPPHGERPAPRPRPRPGDRPPRPRPGGEGHDGHDEDRDEAVEEMRVESERLYNRELAGAVEQLADNHAAFFAGDDAAIELDVLRSRARTTLQEQLRRLGEVPIDLPSVGELIRREILTTIERGDDGDYGLPPPTDDNAAEAYLTSIGSAAYTIAERNARRALAGRDTPESEALIELSAAAYALTIMGRISAGRTLEELYDYLRAPLVPPPPPAPDGSDDGAV